MGLTSRVYCAEQIDVPTELPATIKKLTKEIIRYNSVWDDPVTFAREYFAAKNKGELEQFLEQCEEMMLTNQDQMNALREDVEAVGGERQTDEAMQLLMLIFRVLDTDMDDCLSLAEIVEGLDGTPLGEVLLPHLPPVETYDGPLVDFAIFASWWPELTRDTLQVVHDLWLETRARKILTELGYDIFSAVFRLWDADGNGKLDIKEIVTAIEKARLPQEFTRLLLRADINGDGVITLEEFLVFLPANDGMVLTGLMLGVSKEQMAEITGEYGLPEEKLEEIFADYDAFQAELEQAAA